MKVTPFSDGHYYPLLLASGKDGVLINYDGSNYVSKNGHTHDESHQGAPVGWYKMSTSSALTTTQPIVAAGVQVIYWNAPAEPRMYEQKFDPRTATVSTLLTFSKDAKICIESFMTSDSIWCEKVSVLSVPEGIDMDIAFEVSTPRVGGLSSCMKFKNEYSVKPFADGNSIKFSYTNKPFKGNGLLLASLPFDGCKISLQDIENSFADGIYKNVKEGFTVSRTMICVGDEENTDFEKLSERAMLGYDALHIEHKKEWNEYFGCCDINIPDEKIKEIYDFNRYVNKAHQHPEVGLVSLGMLPNQWRGGICCGYDQAFPHAAFLTSGNFKESKKYTDSYLLFADDCRKILKEHGINGTTFYGWTTCDGQYVRHEVDKFDWITKFKPMFSAFSIIAMYNEWMYHPEAITEEHIKVIKEQLTFYTEYMLTETEDIAFIKPVDSATEGEFAVKLDSVTQINFAAAFKYAGEILNSERYTEIAKKMYAALKPNYDGDGRLLSHEGAPYTGGLLREVYQYLPYSKDNEKFFEEECEASKTLWGIDNDLPFEEYRHWPWNDSKVARVYIRMGKPEKAMPHILHIPYGASSHGSLPEKLRLDGYPVNYYYTSASGLAVTAINEAFACDVYDGAVMLAGGFAKPWADFSCRDIRVKGNISISFTVKNGKFTSLEIRNDSDEDKKIKLRFNSQYKVPENISEVKVKKGICYKIF